MKPQPFDSLAWLWNESAKVAKNANQRMCRDAWLRLCLYHRLGEVCASSGTPAGFEFTWNEAIPLNLTVEQLTAWCVERLRKVSCLPEGV